MLLLLLVWGGAVGLGLAVRGFRAGGVLRLRASIAAVAMLILVLALGVASPVSQKMLAYLIMPLGLMWLVLIAVWAELLRAKLRGLSLAVGGVLLLYSVAGNPVVGALGLQKLQDEVPLVDWSQGPPFDAVLVLGGGTKHQPPPADYGLSGAGDRVLLGARLYFKGRTSELICSGRGVPGLKVDDLTEATTRIWTDIGIPEHKIHRLREPYNTKEELKALAKLMASKDWKRVGLVTSGYHLPRAMGLAAKQGLDLVPLTADQFLGEDKFTVLSLIPRRTGFLRTELVVWEHIGRWVGR